MKAAPWLAAAAAAADPARARLRFEQLITSEVEPPLSAITLEHARIVAALFSGSQAMGLLLLKHPRWLHAVLSPDLLTHPRQESGLRREISGFLEHGLAARDYAGTLTKLRQFKQRELLRIAARDLARLGPTSRIIREISDVADVCLNATRQVCLEQLIVRLGRPYHPDANGVWQPTQFAILGLGKLGGQELNYSSDVDVLFLYSEEGHVFKAPPRQGARTERALSNHHFFKRLAESFIAEVSRSTPDGILYRIDLRLRPEGDAGPLVRSLAGYENYYAQWGQTWERMMLIKARGVAGDAALVSEFLETVQPFRYPRSLGQGALREIAAMKTLIENEVVRSGELDRNVKLGRGGIREIEFVVQSGQLLHAGRLPFLQGAQTLPALEKLDQYKLLAGAEARDLAAAYEFLRDVEHRVQMEDNLQTHTIPADLPARTRLAAVMGHPTLKKFDEALRRHTDRVRQIYDRLVRSEQPAKPSLLPSQFRGAESAWQKVLADHGFQDAANSFRLLNEFAHGPGYVHVSRRTTELAIELIPKFLSLCAGPGPSGEVSGAATRAPSPAAAPKTRRDTPSPKTPAAPELEAPNAKRLSDPDRVLARHTP